MGIDGIIKYTPELMMIYASAADRKSSACRALYSAAV